MIISYHFLELQWFFFRLISKSTCQVKGWCLVLLLSCEAENHISFFFFFFFLKVDTLRPSIKAENINAPQGDLRWIIMQFCCLPWYVSENDSEAHDESMLLFFIKAVSVCKWQVWHLHVRFCLKHLYTLYGASVAYSQDGRGEVCSLPP